MDDPIVQFLLVFAVLLVVFGTIAFVIHYFLKSAGLVREGPVSLAPVVAAGAALYTAEKFRQVEKELKELKEKQNKRQ